VFSAYELFARLADSTAFIGVEGFRTPDAFETVFAALDAA
jgi:hypothetical protein